MSKLKIKEFDAAMEARENGGEKEAKRESAKRAKYQQIKTQKDNLENKIYEHTQKLEKSYTDSSIDSVRTYMDLQVLEKELTACDEIMTGLFPNGLSKNAAKNEN